ncbi:hypothetical protein S40288_08488 [Stachybotrys chartarum IBT 40288]|nr:hypothetical protein S40288_08488 [Stachybotrys chartarum IBT 40288]
MGPDSQAKPATVADVLSEAPARKASGGDVAHAKLSSSTQADADAHNDPNAPEATDARSHERLIEADETSAFEARFRAVESKIGLVDTLYGLHKSAAEGINYEHKFSVGMKLEEYEEARELSFLQDSMHFLSRIRHSYQTLQSLQEQRKLKGVEEKKKVTHSETDIVREASTKAFLSGEPAKILQVNWDTFVTNAPEPDLSILSPIEVISSEPDPRIISQLELTYSNKTGKKKKPKLGIDSLFSTDKGNVQSTLPERIRISSAYLFTIMATFETSPVLLPGSKTAVFLRPFQHLIYNETLLRQRLAALEEKYENYNPNMAEPTSAVLQGESAPTENIDPPPGSAPTPGDEATGGQETALDGESNGKAAPGDEDDDQDKGDKEESGADEIRTSITALLHLRCLVGFIDSEIMPKKKYFRSDECTHVHFHDLWYLFKPGDELMEQNGKQAYVVLHVQVPVHKVEDPWEQWNKRGADNGSDSGSDSEEDGNPFTLHCAYIDFDGKNFGPVKRKFHIPPFGDHKAIKSLPVYPFRFAKSSDTRQKFHDRGRMLLNVAKFKAMYYMGVTVDTRDEIDSQVVVDFNEALVDQERREAWEPFVGPISMAAESRDDECSSICCRDQVVVFGHHVDTTLTENYVKSLLPSNRLAAPSLILSPRSLEETLGSIDQLSETELLIMTYRVFGFILRSRKWAQLDLGFLRYEDINARDSKVGAFDRLELPSGHREMVKSLVVQHFRSKHSLARDEQTDLVQGKGKGLIILLHGAPGVGKTTTAEGIAELFKKPLFQITCGDLGTTAKEVEASLEKNFALASRWGCILLLDEADVFLASRERTDFQRNGLVAVFLRVLEYYTGILFLTTNRIGDFDEAFASRIHMSLYYPELDEEKTLKVFRLNLDLIQERFSKHGRKIIFDASSIEDFAQQHFINNKYNRWNGRQIRNACQTALALAEFDAQGGTLNIDSELNKDVDVRLELKYFKIVQRAYLDFGQYLGEINGSQGDRRAIDLKLRARTSTPYEANRNLFSQRQDTRPSTGQNLQPQYKHPAPRRSYGHPEDPYSPGHLPGTPSPSRSQFYGQHSSYSQHSQGYERPPGLGSHGPYAERSSGVLETPQQGQTDPRFSQGSPQAQYESPLPGDQPARQTEFRQAEFRQSGEQQGMPWQPGMGFVGK